MADASGLDLPYGNFGRIDYDPRDRSWHFGRDLKFPPVLKPLGNSHIAYSPIYTSEDESGVRNNLSETRHAKEISALMKSHPELLPASSLLHPLLRVSEAVSNVEQCYDPLRGCSMTFGSSAHPLGQRIPVLVSLSDVTRCTLRMMHLTTQKRGWGESKTSWIEVPVPHGEATTWTSAHGPIQQICLSQSNHGLNMLLAVRLLTVTLFFHAVHKAESTRDLGGSPISLNGPYKINILETGGLSHADVALNPWSARQAAIIDQAGQWRAMAFDSINFTRLVRRWNAPVSLSNTEKSSLLYDGWGRIAWVTDSSTLAVFSRRSLKFFKIYEEGTMFAKEVDLGFTGNSDWILDMAVLSDRKNLLCILTTAQLIVYRVSSSERQDTTVETVSQLRHFRDPEDLGMRLSFWTEDEYIALVLYSGSNRVMSMFYLDVARSTPVLCGDISNIDLTELIPPTSNNCGISSIILNPLETQIDESETETLVQNHTDKHLRFYSIMMLLDDTTLIEGLLYSSPVEHSSMAANALCWHSEIEPPKIKTARNGFLVRDEEAVEDGNQPGRIEPLSRYARREVHPKRDQKKIQSLEHIAAELHTRETENISLEQVLTEVGHLVNSSVSDMLIPSTLNGFAQGEVSAQDIDEASSLLQSLDVSQPSLPSSTKFDDDPSERVSAVPTSVALPPFVGMSNAEGASDFRSLYDAVISGWITSLSTTVPGRIRLAKSRLARSVAAEVMLARRYLMAKPTSDESATAEAQSSPVQPTWDLPMRASQAPPSQGSFTGPSQRFRTASPLSTATPSSPAAASMHTASSDTSSTSGARAPAPEVARLRQYTAFTGAGPGALPRSLRSVLAHWAVGADPQAYDWASAARAQTRALAAAAAGDADADLTDRERARAARRADRRRRRLRNEAAATLALRAAHSHLPALEVASQPLPSAAGPASAHLGAPRPATSQPPTLTQTHTQSSQLPAAGGQTMSQLVSGRFGGRPPPRKKRKSGF